MVLHWALQGPLKGPCGLRVPGKAVFTFSKEIHSLYPLNIMEHVYGHCCPSPRFREPSWTFMDPQVDPKMDLARLVLGDPYR